MNAPLTSHIIYDKGGVESIRLIIYSIAYRVVDIHVARNLHEHAETLENIFSNLPFTLLKIHYRVRNKTTMTCASSGSHSSCSKITPVCVGRIDSPMIAAR